MNVNLLILYTVFETIYVSNTEIGTTYNNFWNFISFTKDQASEFSGQL